MELSTTINKSLTEYTLNMLRKQKIFTVIDFVRMDAYKLIQITNLEAEVIKRIKDDFLYLLTPFEGIGYLSETITTGIQSFDDLLGGGLKSGNIYDFCGLSASGKTQICHSIAINLAIHYKYETLYVDAKNDFSGQRIYNALTARNCSDIDCGVIMNCIRCQPIYDVHEFLNILRGLPAYLKEHRQTKCLVVDSLPALWFPLMDGKKNGLSLLSEATNLMHKLAFAHDMIFLLVNIVTRRTETDETPRRCKTKTTVALGKYWQTVPRQRFLLTKAEGSKTQPAGQRTIKIIEREGKGKKCEVKITNEGVV